ncbi:unnamed protein product [Phyllotreta striolata]|uniref:Peptidase S1 domain-containing protein n=1 Tax=Phyllotreta striolata TaxID=444603 RepID=A0A9N9TMT8_PHYSR|nr:unnamed protein product [Phyllotreta striolata]
MDAFQIAIFVWCVLRVIVAKGLHDVDFDDTECIALKNCAYATDLIKYEKYAPSTLEYLRKFGCGYTSNKEPLIKCPKPINSIKKIDCYTTDGREGMCKTINECKTLTHSYINFSDIKICTDDVKLDKIDMKVCCPSTNDNGFPNEVPDGYHPKLILEEDSSLQEIRETQNMSYQNKSNSYDETSKSESRFKQTLDQSINSINDDKVSYQLVEETAANSSGNQKGFSTLQNQTEIVFGNVESASQENLHSHLQKVIETPDFNPSSVIFPDEEYQPKIRKTRRAKHKENVKKPTRQNYYNHEKSRNLFYNRLFYPSVNDDIRFAQPPQFAKHHYFDMSQKPSATPNRINYRHYWSPFPPRPFYENNYNYEKPFEQPAPNHLNPRSNFQTCGRLPKKEKSSIVGGTPVALGEYPWMALLQYNGKNNTKNGCGGTLINSQFVLTAAHCVDDTILKSRRMTLYRVILGEYDSSKNPDCVSTPQSVKCAHPSKAYQISEIVKHPQFVLQNAQNDIALIKLDREVEFTDYIKPVCLPNENSYYDTNTRVMVAGWGKTHFKGKSSQILKKAILPVVNRAYCNAGVNRLIIGQICLGYGNGEGTCNGDSGGPLMIQRWENAELVTYQLGIISYGLQECGTELSVNTFIPVYLNWIYSIIGVGSG